MRARAERIILLALTVMLVSAFLGCAWIGDLLYDASANEEPPEETQPAPTEESEDIVQNDGTNPVFAYYISFFGIYRKARAGMLEQALASDDADLRRAYGQLERDVALMERAYSTVGRLAPSSDTPEPFAGDIDGAFAGNGSISSGGEFTFTLADGGSIEGAVEGALLHFTLKEGGLETEVGFSRSGRGYTARLSGGGETRYFELTRSGIRWTSLPGTEVEAPAGELFFPENGGSPVLTYSDGGLRLSE